MIVGRSPDLICGERGRNCGESRDLWESVGRVWSHTFPMRTQNCVGKVLRTSKHQLILNHRRLEGRLEAASLVSMQKLCISDIRVSAVGYLREEIQEEE